MCPMSSTGGGVPCCAARRCTLPATDAPISMCRLASWYCRKWWIEELHDKEPLPLAVTVMAHSWQRIFWPMRLTCLRAVREDC